MTDLLTSSERRAVEAAAIDSGRVTGLELMERAGQGVVDAIYSEFPDLARRRHRWYQLWRPRGKVVVFCGPGNNGGDGFVIARLLRRLGWRVVVLHLFAKKTPPPDTYENCKRWMQRGKLFPFTDDKARHPLLHSPHPDLWIDAVFGIGQTRPLPDLVDQMFRRVFYEQNWSRAPVVAVDIPTGLNADTGEKLEGFGLRADLTVTFHTEKPGHRFGEGPQLCGKVMVKDIGL